MLHTITDPDAERPIQCPSAVQKGITSSSLSIIHHASLPSFLETPLGTRLHSPARIPDRIGRSSAPLTSTKCQSSRRMEKSTSSSSNHSFIPSSQLLTQTLPPTHHSPSSAPATPASARPPRPPSPPPTYPPPHQAHTSASSCPVYRQSQPAPPFRPQTPCCCSTFPTARDTKPRVCRGGWGLRGG